ncbi:hypothetical protein IVB38_10290 [Bradyrhizobium sp. 38]|uniref:hypothetical protein n=1 Tax=unclassified Bradyrhizobium TaxID=2631580 RepID=UPI001FF718CE|nr:MULTISPECIES: hypothetical protein [unclassified Bradyrhizobium]MCK1336412.1 hypothetical protein [Bradyrhizobium sp. 38]MCK1781326.1 hypothetical protein [Bradyrhizobium sp. 132]
MNLRTALTEPSRTTYEMSAPSSKGWILSSRDAGCSFKRSTQYEHRASEPVMVFLAPQPQVNDGILSVHSHVRFDIARAVGIEPVNGSGHRVKRHTSTSS